MIQEGYRLKDGLASGLALRVDLDAALRTATDPTGGCMAPQQRSDRIARGLRKEIQILENGCRWRRGCEQKIEAKMNIRIGARVIRKGAPEVQGTVIAMRDRDAKVYWATHTSTWIDADALDQPNPEEKAPRVRARI